MNGSVAIIGGGLAGLAAATALAPRGFSVTIYESRNRLGGRAGSFTDTATGQLIDACQHVSMGCCTNFDHFCRTVGIDRYLQPQPCLYFMTPDRRVSRFQAGSLPAPFHLAGAFLKTHYLSAGDKVRIGWGLWRLRHSERDDDPPFADWLFAHGQTRRTIARFWSVVLTSALNEAVDRVGLRYARKVFVEGFLGHRRGFEVALPSVPLGRLYGEELQKWFHKHDVRIRLNESIKGLDVQNGKVSHGTCRQGSHVDADWYIAAVPQHRLLDLLPAAVTDEHSMFANLRRLESSPITSVHLWYANPVMKLPHAVLIDCLGQWVFNRGEVAPGEHYVQIVVSAARQFRGMGHEEVERQVVEEMGRLFTAAKPESVLRARVVTEHAATFSAVPGVDQWRPPQATPIGNLFLAGDWTATGWPATMEGAVRSGYLAAEALLDRVGNHQRLVQPDLL
jgi:squalene-associated FAD-dependent desaturase